MRPPFDRRDEVRLRDTCFAPEVVCREIALKEALTGVDAVIGFMRDWARTFPQC